MIVIAPVSKVYSENAFPSASRYLKKSHKGFLIWNYFITFAVLLKDTMDRPVFQLVLLEAARDFLKTLPAEVRKKIYFNIKKVQGGIKDNDLFKKLDNT